VQQVFVPAEAKPKDGSAGCSDLRPVVLCGLEPLTPRAARLGMPDGFRVVQPGQAFVPGVLAGVADVDDEE